MPTPILWVNPGPIHVPFLKTNLATHPPLLRRGRASG